MWKIARINTMLRITLTSILFISFFMNYGHCGNIPTPLDAENKLLPFGSNLFIGAFSSKYEQGLNANYRITEGDRISVRIWGAKSFEGVLTADSQGNIFIPEVGPVHVLGVKNKDLDGIVRRSISQVYSNNIEVYTNLLDVQPIGVFVTGYVKQPGRYAGNMVDSILYYIDQAGGILEPTGSYRRISVIREGQELVNVDLYDFLLLGIMPNLQLEDSDTILVREGISRISASGTVSNSFVYEFNTEIIKGEEVVRLSKILPEATHVLVEGVRQGQPINWYITLDEFRTFDLHDGDKTIFFKDIKADTITVRIMGAHEGPSAMAVRRDARLLEVLSYVKIDPNIADLNSIYIRRARVAAKQKEALEASLLQLEKSVLTAPSASAEEAIIRKNEAELVMAFIEKVKHVKPEGRVVVTFENRVNNIALEENDEIVIQQKSDVVLINGEVLLPQAVIFTQSSRAEDYIHRAGGYSDRADKSKVLVVRANGETEIGRSVLIGPGDQILVLAKTPLKSLQWAKDITQILYQIAIATKVALTF